MNSIGKNNKQKAAERVEGVVPHLTRVHPASAQQYIGNDIGGCTCPSKKIQE
jgi:hypothetical protein